MSHVLFSAMRNEGPFILEWVAYHRLIGFDRVVIVSNDCDDGSDALLEALDAAGAIEWHPQNVIDGLSPQRSAVEMTERLGVLSDGDWAIFLDADEYLNIKIGTGLIGDLTSYLADDRRVGMLINWRIFGDNGHLRHPGSYLRSDFTLCEEQPERTLCKTLFQKGPVATGFSGYLHRCRLTPGAGAVTDFITGSQKHLAVEAGWRMKRSHHQWLKNGEWGNSWIKGPEIGYDLAQVNHYMVRDKGSFGLKKNRGRGHVAEVGANTRHTDEFYQQHNLNQVADDSILRWADPVARYIKELLLDAKIEEAQSEVIARYNATVLPHSKNTSSQT